MNDKKGSIEMLEIEQEVDNIIKEDGIDGLKETMVEMIMQGVDSACDNDESDYGRMLRIAKKHNLYNPDVVSLILVSVLPMSIETATMAMREIVENSDGSPIDLSEDQIKFVKIMEKESKIKLN